MKSYAYQYGFINHQLTEKKLSIVTLFAILFIIVFSLIMLSTCDVTPARAENIYLQASWYSLSSLKSEGTFKYSKGVMANGKLFNEDAFTCATRDYKLGTILRITNLANGKTIQVMVTDRIAKRFTGKRIDLSKRAFEILTNGHLELGVIKVKVEIIVNRIGEYINDF
jgi:rare lipoprotein A